MGNEVDKPRFRVAARRETDLVAQPKPVTPQRERRFKVQQCVTVTARDQSNRPYLLGDFWRTVVQADKQATAERYLMTKRVEEPGRAWRLAEEWPMGSNLREIAPARKRKRIAIQKDSMG